MILDMHTPKTQLKADVIVLAWSADGEFQCTLKSAKVCSAAEKRHMHGLRVIVCTSVEHALTDRGRRPHCSQVDISIASG